MKPVNEIREARASWVQDRSCRFASLLQPHEHFGVDFFCFRHTHPMRDHRVPRPGKLELFGRRNPFEFHANVDPVDARDLHNAKLFVPRYKLMYVRFGAIYTSNPNLRNFASSASYALRQPDLLPVKCPANLSSELTLKVSA